MSYVNLGCGARYHPDWINFDIEPQGPGVIRADLSKGIPFPGSTADIVYHAAVLEHIRRADAPAFLAECLRILRPGGVLRIGVPDLEEIATLYLQKLRNALAGDQHAAADYDWIMLELLDQTVREQSGGEMLEYLKQHTIPNEGFVLNRIGDEGRHLLNLLRTPAHPGIPIRSTLLQRVKTRVKSLPGRAKLRLMNAVLSDEEKRALSIGRFRIEGEVHQWMYDRFSLGRLLTACGFVDIRFHSSSTSDIPQWEMFHLDVLPDGQLTKPDLFFAEARKPDSAVA